MPSDSRLGPTEVTASNGQNLHWVVPSQVSALSPRQVEQNWAEDARAPAGPPGNVFTAYPPSPFGVARSPKQDVILTTLARVPSNGFESISRQQSRRACGGFESTATT